MARPPSVTRHVIHTECICRCIHIPTGTVFGKIVDLDGIITDRKKVMQKCKKILETKDVHILTIERTRCLKSFVLQTPTEFVRKGKILMQTEITSNDLN